MNNKVLVKTSNGHPNFNRIMKEFDPQNTPSQTLFMLEDLSTEWIEYFGCLLSIDPHFFANHLRSSEYEHNNNKTNAPVLPPARRHRNYTVLSYFKPIFLETECELHKTELTDFNILRRMTLRHVKGRKGDKDEITIALVTRMVCFWNKTWDNGSWVSVLLTDPALPKHLRIKNKVSEGPSEYKTWSGGRMEEDTLIFARGQECKRFPNRMHPKANPWDRTNITLEKIALSDWMLTLAFLRRDYDALHMNQFVNENTDPEMIDRLLSEIASSRDLIAKCCSFARRNLINLGICPNNQVYFSGWRDKLTNPLNETNADWTYLYMELQHWKTDTDILTSSQLNLLKALDSKRAQVDSERERTEARDLNRLSYMGVFFIPMGCATGILSMGNDFSPGKRQFWVFFVIWVPITAIVVLWWWTSRILQKWGAHARSHLGTMSTTHQE
ncbi:hypothetical protein B0J14DRAFT_707890 [Halenospora varia]|nr:hypothetical protein B0J14DRAFT_707890 [Halenospora varia]